MYVDENEGIQTDSLLTLPNVESVSSVAKTSFCLRRDYLFVAG